jgi:diguanylate cyclase (GGDEF)-like protein
MSTHTQEVFTQDEFLQQPFLFRYGPWLMWAIGLLMAAAFYFVAAWRIEEGRRGVYDIALRTAQTAAEATQDSLGRTLGGLEQATRAIEALAAKTPESQETILRAARTLGLLPQNIEAFAVSAKGDIIASTLPVEPQAQWLDSIRHDVHSVRPPDGAHMFPAIPANGHRMLPLARSVTLAGIRARMVYLVNTDELTAVAEKAMGGKHSWLQIVDANERPLLSTRTDIAASAFALTVEAAMARPLDWASQRFLVADTHGSMGLSVRAGVREDEVLVSFRERVDASWYIAIGVSLFVLTMVGIVSYALRRFSVKERYLRNLATVDILTELPNRRSFHTLLAQACDRYSRAGEPMGLLFIDLDNFKHVNDTLGHNTGDRLLRQVARVLCTTIGERGRVCRLGGDEFTVLLPGVRSASHAQRIGEAVTQALRTPLDIAGLQVQPRASVGIALMPMHAHEAPDLMRFADMALYQAKRNGKSCAVVYDKSMASRELAEESFMRELEQAIRDDELYLEYQPKFHMANKALSGFEALVRWRHPKRGVVPPGEFIALAERSGLINDLGAWVLAHAVKQIQSWHNQGFGWQRVAVNVSPLQLRDNQFIAYVKRVLARCEVPGGCLQIELTEGSLANDPAKAQELVRELRSLGVKVAVDDFGTGYSSLGALQDFELDCLKIDRSFVTALHTPKGQEICRAVISFGHALGLHVIAEGVETDEQSEWLLLAQCDEVQGYRYGKPMAPREAIRRVLACSTSVPAMGWEASFETAPGVDADAAGSAPAGSPKVSSAAQRVTEH